MKRLSSRSDSVMNTMKTLKTMSARDVPLIAIIGSTGCSKTRLSLELCHEFRAEIISADSMQVYCGLDIITNKATTSERALTPHHLIDFLDPMSRFTVTDFRNRALKVIKDLMSRGIVPILVGGTNYYIESILWEVLIDSNQELDEKCLVFDGEEGCHQWSEEELTKERIMSEPIYSGSFSDISSEILHKILEQLDPITALEIHPKNKRKVIRSLQIYQQKKRPKSELISEQKTMNGGSQLGGPLRFKNSVILWMDCDNNVLNQRLDKRVDEMMERGLIEELLDFHHNYNKQRISQNLSADYSKGIFQSIGFKEFHKYLLLTEEQRKTNPFSEIMLRESTESLKYVTKRYARHQLKWIRNRFLRLNDREVPNIYRLDTTSPELWTQEVFEPSMAIVSAYVTKSEVPSHIKPVPKIEVNENHSKRFQCKDCSKVLDGLVAYEAHLKSKGHEYNLKLKRKRHLELISILKSYENEIKS
ncbi:unnamed protein product [Medioppia subpectinata]|uniref:C2H2-type domain-containing protein n=1 Tax=Medioppia subpectinata TaxID=1979941 RepID=A0A7R9L721_9ACAR|nr:unnamed protein product [Medioppia subpectinata]CAG2115462.1 unnamed protein product [Medioppia subpectinata]